MANFRSYRILCATLLLSLGCPASGKQLPSEQLEKAEDAPVYIYRTESSPAMNSSFGGFTSYQVNVDANGNNIVGDAANEPSLAVDPTDHSRITVGWRQFDSVTSNFRQAGWGYTTDAGMSWTFPGVLQGGVFRSDPVLASDETGRFFYLSLLQSFFDDMWRSIDGGASWNYLAPARGGDKQWFTIDRTSSSGHGFQYQSWSTAGNNYGGRQFTRSIDGGFNWSDPVNIPNAPIWGTLDVDTNGVLFLVGVNSTTNQIWCERSTTARFGAVVPSFDQSTVVNLGGNIVSSEPINPEGLVGQLYLQVDRSGGSTNNNVYVLASVQPSGFSNGSEVMFARSTDSGRTFSAPVRVNDDPLDHRQWHWLGTFAAAPNGRLDAVWFDTRNSTNFTDSQLFYSYSTDAGRSWSSNVAVTAPFNPYFGYPNQNKIGDYISIVSDNSGADVAYTATFNGEEDVYYVRLSPFGSQLSNISTRALVLTGDDVAIGGFIISGNSPKQVLIRGIGPSLSSFHLTGVLADPTLELHQGTNVIATNDNWKVSSDGTSQQAQIEATGRPPTNDAESALLVTLNPGAYTAILAGKNNGTGIGLVEIFDQSPQSDSQLTNISTRGFVGTGDNVLIGGVTVGGGNDNGAKVIVRALGPSLSNFSVHGPLADPTLTLYDVNGNVLTANDDWKVDAQTGLSQEAQVRGTGRPPSDDRESVIVTTLAAGKYTAIVRGKNDTTGVALVEVYRLQ
ncbi:MAG TPA: sialidase family protein [Chthoniobacterales bacterium]